MSYSNRPADEPTTTTFGRSDEGTIGQHVKHDERDPVTTYPIRGTAERIEEETGLGTGRPAALGGGRDEHLQHVPLRDDQKRTDMRDFRGLYDESDTTRPGFDPSARRVGEGHTTEAPHRSGLGHHERTAEDTRRTYPGAHDPLFGSTGRGTAGNVMGRKDEYDDESRRTFPAGEKPHDTTRTSDMRDDETRHRTFPGEEDRDVMSTGSRRAGKVVDEGHNMPGGMPDDTDRHRTFPAGDDTNPHRTRCGLDDTLTPGVHQVGAVDRGVDHPTGTHHDPRHEGLRRTDDRVDKGSGDVLHGKGPGPHYGSKDTSTRTTAEGVRDTDDSTYQDTTGTPGHVGMGAKIRGAAEQFGGMLMNDPVREQKGKERKAGQLDESGAGPTGVHNK